jgi:hypothetical protein
MLSSKVHPAIQKVNIWIKGEIDNPIPSLLQRTSNPFFFLEIDRLLEISETKIDLEEKVLIFHRLIFILFLKVKKGNNITIDVPLEAETHLKKRKEVWKSYLELNQIDRKRLYFAYKVMLVEANRSTMFKSTFPFEGSRQEKESKLSQAITKRRDRLRKKKFVPLEEKKEEVEVIVEKEIQVVVKKEESIIKSSSKEIMKCEAILKTGNRKGQHCGVRASYQKGESWVCGKHNK